MREFFEKLFDTSGFPARWECGNWPTEVGWLHIVSDCAIFLAYAAIPTALLVFILRRRDVPVRRVFWLFILFILSCGLTHLLDAIMFYQPMYRFLGLMKFVTACVSLTTAVALIRLFPVATRIRVALTEHETMTRQLGDMQGVEERLVRERDQLETRSSQLTARERRLRTAMLLTRTGSARWNARTNEIDWETGTVELLLEHPITTSSGLSRWSDILDPSEIERLQEASREAARSRKPVAVELRLRAIGDVVRSIQVAMAVESVQGEEPVMMTGLIRLMGAAESHA